MAGELPVCCCLPACACGGTWTWTCGWHRRSSGGRTDGRRGGRAAAAARQSLKLPLWLCVASLSSISHGMAGLLAATWQWRLPLVRSPGRGMAPPVLSVKTPVRRERLVMGSALAPDAPTLVPCHAIVLLMTNFSANLEFSVIKCFNSKNSTHRESRSNTGQHWQR